MINHTVNGTNTTFFSRFPFPNQAAWSLKTRALTEQVYLDEIDVDEEGIAEMLMDDNSIAQVTRKVLRLLLQKCL